MNVVAHYIHPSSSSSSYDVRNKYSYRVPKWNVDVAIILSLSVLSQVMMNKMQVGGGNIWNKKERWDEEYENVNQFEEKALRAWWKGAGDDIKIVKRSENETQIGFSILNPRAFFMYSVYTYHLSSIISHYSSSSA